MRVRVDVMFSDTVQLCSNLVDLGAAITITTTAEQVQVGEQIRRLRAAQSMSVRTLATRAGFSPSFISQVENGQVSPSIASLERIATALGTSLAGFFAMTKPGNGVVTRASNRRELASSWSRARIEALASVMEGSRLEAVMVTIAPGGRSGKEPSSHPGEELALVFDGQVLLILGHDTHVLQRGDTASFSSETPHLWENQSTGSAQVVIVSPRFTH